MCDVVEAASGDVPSGVKADGRGTYPSLRVFSANSFTTGRIRLAVASMRIARFLGTRTQ